MLPALQDLIVDDLDYFTRKADGELERLSGSRLWFTGGAGFLGYYLCLGIAHWNRSRPPTRRIELTVLDNFSRGVPAWLEQLASDEIRMIRHDVTEALPDHLPAPDWVVHAASIASPIVYRRYPLETIDANVWGLRRLLDYVDGRSLQGMLFFSTSEIYGDPPPDEIPTRETFRGLVSCTGPRACYDESKRLGETLCVVFAETCGVPVRIVRPFNNYGPGLRIDDGRVLPDFARDALAGRDIVMRSDGSPTRTFCYVTDALTGYLKVLVHGRSGEPYNIGMQQDEISMRELAELVAHQARDLWGYRGRVVHRPSDDGAYLQDNPNRRCPDIGKARSELGYEPEIRVEQGVRRTLIWYHYNRESVCE